MTQGAAAFRGIGAKRMAELERAGLRSAYDIIHRLPASYRDYSRITPVAQLRPGMQTVFIGTLMRRPSFRRVGALSVITAVFGQDGAEAQAVFFNQPYLVQTLRVGVQYRLWAMMDERGGKPCAQNPVLVGEDELGTLLPVYPPLPGVPAKVYRDVVRQSLERVIVSDPLPADMLAATGLMGKAQAMAEAHFPQSTGTLARARRRLSFDELLTYQIALGLMRRGGEAEVISDAAAVDADMERVLALAARMPFQLTGAQRRAVDEICADLRAGRPMARLLQGDVGSGKTAVAQLALYACASAGRQGALMAPTEVLARQHFESFSKLFDGTGITVGLLTGSMSKREHKAAHEAIAEGRWDIVLGTHALITEGVEYSDLGLVVTDEQHRFGVGQRSALSGKGDAVNVLAMSATPIPRSLTLILYGDLDVTVLDELPAGRTPIKTYIVGEAKRKGMYDFIRARVAEGRQAYVVCPLIEKSEALDVMSAMERFDELERAMPGVRVGLCHGAMGAKAKQAAMDSFTAGQTDVLVSTTVIEVGVNVPNATVMVVEDAHRFGLAQLHQLRGRVGRGAHESFCFLMAKRSEKLSIMAETTDGFEIARRDLELRGPGDLLGTRQSGLLDAGVAAGIGDMALLEESSRWAKRVLADPQRYSELIEYVDVEYRKRLETAGVS